MVVCFLRLNLRCMGVAMDGKVITTSNPAVLREGIYPRIAAASLVMLLVSPFVLLISAEFSIVRDFRRDKQMEPGRDPGSG